jgi:hypothetical protein
VFTVVNKKVHVCCVYAKNKPRERCTLCIYSWTASSDGNNKGGSIHCFLGFLMAMVVSEDVHDPSDSNEVCDVHDDCDAFGG